MKYFAGSAIALLLVMSSPVAASAKFNGVDPAVPGTFAIPNCETGTQLDCIESVEVKLLGQSDYTPATYLSKDFYFEKNDSLGNEHLVGQTYWQYQTGDGLNSKFGINAELATPKRKLPYSPGLPTYAGGFAMNINNAEDDLSTNVRVVARTSWFKPVDVSIYAAEPSFSYQKIKGGYRWVYSGVRTIESGYSDPGWAKKMESGAIADYDDTRFFFGADYAGKNMNESFYNPSCATKGFTVRGSNATSAGQPTWNSYTQSLEFNIGGAHRDTKGKLNKGFFYLWVDKAYIKCMWPSSGLANAKSFAVSVYNENGTKQLATTTVTYSKGQLKVSAVNFHYSSPTIRLKARK